MEVDEDGEEVDQDIELDPTLDPLEAEDSPECIHTPGMTEVYLTSSEAIQGTRNLLAIYVLIYDEIGLKLSELELLTYWTTHLYPRCTEGVSIDVSYGLSHFMYVYFIIY